MPERAPALVKAGFTPTLHHWAQEHRPIIDPAKGVYAFDDLLVLNNAKMPAVLLECGVIVNRTRNRISTPQVPRANDRRNRKRNFQFRRDPAERSQNKVTPVLNRTQLGTVYSTLKLDAVRLLELLTSTV